MLIIILNYAAQLHPNYIQQYLLTFASFFFRLSRNEAELDQLLLLIALKLVAVVLLQIGKYRGL